VSRLQFPLQKIVVASFLKTSSTRSAWVLAKVALTNRFSGEAAINDERQMFGRREELLFPNFHKLILGD